MIPKNLIAWNCGKYFWQLILKVFIISNAIFYESYINSHCVYVSIGQIWKLKVRPLPDKPEIWNFVHMLIFKRDL